MSRALRTTRKTGLMVASLAALAMLATACGDDATASGGTSTDGAGGTTETAAPGGDAAPAAEWVTAAERDRLTGEYPDTQWLAAAFLPAGVDEPVAADRLEMRYIAFQPAEDQLDMIPLAETLTILRGARPEGLQNALADVDLTLLGFATEGTTATLDFGEGIAATRSMSATEGQLAFNQLIGTIAPYFPDADLAVFTVEGQTDPELFGGLDTTQPFAIRQ